MENFITNLGIEIEQKIQQLDLEKSVIQQSKDAIDVYLDVILRLKQFIVQYNFKNEDEEIYFFKEVKPKFSSALFFYIRIYSIEMNIVCISKESKIEYYKKEQERVQLSAKKNIEIIRYLRSGDSCFDKELFLRGKGDYFKYCKDFIFFDKDNMFSTIGDFMVAKHLSVEMILKYINNRINNLVTSTVEGENVILPKIKVTWTGKKNELIELMYALHSIGCFNWGTISLEKLAIYFGIVFNADLKNHARDFSEMKIRNVQTPFIDKMKNYILARMNKLKISKGRKREISHLVCHE